MSSISFPHSHGHSPSPSTSSVHEGSYYPPPFESNSSFQMNPLSSHPPRTPRTSILSTSSQVYGTSIYEKKDEASEQTQTTEDDEEDEETLKMKEAAKRVRKEEVWRDMLITSNGRDKAFKLMQYSIRLYLLFHASVTTSRVLKRPSKSPFEIEMVKRLESTASGLSFTRKLLILFNWLPPLTTVMAQQSVPYSTDDKKTSSSPTKMKPLLYALLHAPPPVLLEFVHAMADDVYTFSRLGLLGPRTGERAGRFSDWCWLLSTLVGLVENGVERSMIGNLQRDVESRMYAESMAGATAKSKPRLSKIDERELGRLQKQDYWLQISRAKLVMDLVFVSYDLFKIKRARDPVKTVTGLTAAILSYAKLYDRHKNTLVKAVQL